MKFALAFSALLHLSLGQKEPQLTQCLYDDGGDCTVNTAIALSALGSPEAIEETFDMEVEESIEIVEQIMICGTYKSKERCPRDIGCIWVEGPTKGIEYCEIYARVIPEYLSCVQEDPAAWAFLKPAEVKAAFAEMEITKETGVRCKMGKTFFEHCEVDPEDDRELAACPPISQIIFSALATTEAFDFIGVSLQTCTGRGKNPQTCEIADPIQPEFVPAKVTALTLTVTKVEDATPEEMVERLGVHFDLPLLQIFVGEENDAGEHEIRIISIAEGQTIAIYDILTNKEVTDSNPLDLTLLELVDGSVVSYLKVPIEIAFDSEADISEYEGELPALTDIIGVEDLIPQTNLVIEDASDLAAKLMAIPQTVQLGGGEEGPSEADESNSPPPEVEAEDDSPPPEEEAEDNSPPPEVEAEDNSPPPEEEAEDDSPPPEEEAEDNSPPPEVEAEDDSPPPEEEAVDGNEDPETAELDSEDPTDEDSSSADVDDPEDTDATADNAEPPAEGDGTNGDLGLSQVGYAAYAVLLATALVQMAM